MKDNVNKKYLIVTGDLYWSEEDKSNFEEKIKLKFKNDYNSVIVFTENKNISFQVLGSYGFVKWINSLVKYLKYIWK